ncbi:MAG: hypothetical protein ACR2P0_06835 [Acidimicrobiales bacterium]
MTDITAREPVEDGYPAPQSIDEWSELRRETATPGEFDTSAGGRVAAGMLVDERDLRAAHRSLPIEKRVSGSGKRVQALLNDAEKYALEAQRGAVDALSARVRGDHTSLATIRTTAYQSLERASAALDQAHRMVMAIDTGVRSEPAAIVEPVAPKPVLDHEDQSDISESGDPPEDVADEDETMPATAPLPHLLVVPNQDQPEVAESIANDLYEDPTEVDHDSEPAVAPDLNRLSGRVPRRIAGALMSLGVVAFFAAVVVLTWWVVSSSENWF